MNRQDLPLLSENQLKKESERMELIGSQWVAAMIKAISDCVAVDFENRGMSANYPTQDRDHEAEFIFLRPVGSDVIKGLRKKIVCVVPYFEVARLEGEPFKSLMSYYRTEILTKDSFVRRVILWLRRLNCEFNNQELKALFEISLLTEHQP